MQTKILTRIIPILLLAASVAYVWTNHYQISDWARLYFYEPSTQVAALADDSGMSDRGRDLFYVSSPQVLLEAQFDTVCQFEELGLVLGCYNGREIYVLDVVEEQLEAVETVTAAHEMLHVVYSRLSDGEIEELEVLFERQTGLLNNSRIQEEIDGYREDPESDITNELHSILGTEYADLIPELEEYYSQYFDDRSRVLEKSQQYEAVFEGLEEERTELNIKLTEIEEQVAVIEGEVVALRLQIDSQRQQLDNLRQSNQVDEYLALAASFNQLVDFHNGKISEINTLQIQYDELIDEHNKNVNEQNKLIKSLDSDLQPI